MSEIGAAGWLVWLGSGGERERSARSDYCQLTNSSVFL